MTNEQIEINFTYHAPGPKQAQSYKFIRSDAKELAHKINALVPEGREKAFAMQKLEEAVFWANAGIARQPEK